jgi:hypothetical protein
MPQDEDESWYLDHFSPKELARVSTDGPAALVRSAAVCLALAGAALVAFVWAARVAIGDVETEPGLTAVLTIVAAGLAFAACVFHGRRLSAARRFPEHGIAMETVKDHLRDIEQS